MSRRSILLLLLAALFVGVAWGVHHRRPLVPRLVGLVSSEPPPLPKPDLEPGVAWAGDWFTLERLDSRTIAIGEPRSAGRNFSYLLLGQERALLFDAGQGIADLRPVVDDLTTLPVTVLASHLHYDHVGSIGHFEFVALPDLPEIRVRVRDGVFIPSYAQHLGAVRQQPAPEIRPAEWWPPGHRVDLGGRVVEMRHTPGHTTDSVSLWDVDRRWLFSGDYLTPTPLYAFLPGSSLGDYRATTRTLLAARPVVVEIFGAHDESEDNLVPRQGYSDVEALGRVLEAIGRGEAKAHGAFPRVYPVNDQMEIWADFGITLENDRPR